MRYISTFALFESESGIKEGVDAVFEDHPELSAIGTEEEYSEYLNGIFEKSRILYRGDFKGLTRFKYAESLYEDGRGGKYKYGSGIYFDSEREYSDFFAKQKKGKLYHVLVDFSDAIFFINRMEFITKACEFLGEEGAPTPQIIDTYTKEMQKAEKVLNIMKNRTESETVVGDEKKYKILGTEQDIADFKKWISRREKI